jgi:hypothetical protein
MIEMMEKIMPRTRLASPTPDILSVLELIVSVGSGVCNLQPAICNSFDVFLGEQQLLIW